jgi:hypothetical protein
LESGCWQVESFMGFFFPGRAPSSDHQPLGVCLPALRIRFVDQHSRSR